MKENNKNIGSVGVFLEGNMSNEVTDAGINERQQLVAQMEMCGFKKAFAEIVVGADDVLFYHLHITQLVECAIEKIGKSVDGTPLGNSELLTAVFNDETIINSAKNFFEEFPNTKTIDVWIIGYARDKFQHVPEVLPMGYQGNSEMFHSLPFGKRMEGIPVGKLPLHILPDDSETFARNLFGLANDDIVFHGTSLPSANNILHNGINMQFGSPNADFGQGFYVTGNFAYARKFSVAHYRGHTQPVVLFFRAPVWSEHHYYTSFDGASPEWQHAVREYVTTGRCRATDHMTWISGLICRRPVAIPRVGWNPRPDDDNIVQFGVKTTCLAATMDESLVAMLLV